MVYGVGSAVRAYTTLNVVFVQKPSIFLNQMSLRIMNIKDYDEFYTTTGRLPYSGLSQHFMPQTKAINIRYLQYPRLPRNGSIFPVDSCGLNSTQSLRARNYITAGSAFMDPLTIVLGSANDIIYG